MPSCRTGYVKNGCKYKNKIIMFNVLMILLSGVALGFVLRRTGFLKNLGRSITLTVWLLLFVFGHSIGSNGALMSNFGHYGMQAVMLASACTAGSVLASWLVYVVMFKEKKKGDRQ